MTFPMGHAQAAQTVFNVYPEASSSISNQVFSSSSGYSTLLLSGTILKWTNYMSHWQWRYLVVKDGKMVYFKSKTEQHLGCRGEVTLRYAKVQASFYDPTRFDVTMPQDETQWYFRAESEINRDKWVAVIKSNIELSQRLAPITGDAASRGDPAAPPYRSSSGADDNASTVVGDSAGSHTGFYEMHSSASSLAGLEMPGGRPSMEHNDSLNSLRRAILDINAYKKMLFKQIDQLEGHFEEMESRNAEGDGSSSNGDSSTSDGIRCDILTFKTTINNVQKTLSSATDILSTHESTWRHKFLNLTQQLQQYESLRRRDEVGNSQPIINKVPGISPLSRVQASSQMKRGHRRATSLTSAPVAVERPSSIGVLLPRLPHAGIDQGPLSSPLSDEEFFDAIEDITAHFDTYEANVAHNTRQLKRIKEISHSNSSSYNPPAYRSSSPIATSAQVQQPLEPINKNMSDHQKQLLPETVAPHRYSEKLQSHVRKHMKSLDTSQDADAGWIEFHAEGKMRMFRRDEETPDGRVIDPLRLFHTIESVSAYECLHHFWDTKYRYECDHTIDSFKILEVLDAVTIVVLQDHKRMWPAAKRDALYLSSIQKIPHDCSEPGYIDTWLVTNSSVEHELAPSKNDGSVRVFLDICMICQTFKRDPAKSDQDRSNIYTKIVYISQVDPGGWLPPMALRKVYKTEYPRFLRKFTKFIDEKTHNTPAVLYGDG